MSSDALRLRDGLHRGPAIVGNLGFEGRIDYALVGNTVNVAESIEQRLRGVNPNQRSIIGVSREAIEEASLPLAPVTVEVLTSDYGEDLVLGPRNP